MSLLLLLFDGCAKNNEDSKTSEPTQAPKVTLSVTPPQEDTKDEAEVVPEDSLTLSDYLPVLADVVYVFEGTGNEYASFQRGVDFINTKENKVQFRTDNGGTQTIEVIQLKDQAISVAYKMEEAYYRDNLTDKAYAQEDQEILLKEPLLVGTSWNRKDGSKCSITGVNQKVNTPSGQYYAIEVTTEYKDSTTKEYYAPMLGLVMREFESGATKVSSKLSKINQNTTFDQKISVYLPGMDEKIHKTELMISFHTNDITRLVLENALREMKVKEEYLPLISTATTIKSLYKGTDQIAYIDFSRDFIKDMSAGSGYEAMILQCITNTVGDYYNVKKVQITVDGKLYESGHIAMKKGETFRVDLSIVVK